MVNRAPQKAFRHGKGSSSFKRFLVSELCLGGFWSEQVQYNTFFANCNQLFAIQLRSFHMPTAVIEKGATIFFLSPDWPLMHHSMDQVLVPSTASGRDSLASMPLAGDSSGRVKHMCVKM